MVDDSEQGPVESGSAELDWREHTRALIAGMKVATGAYYAAAVRLGYHQFVEIAGVMQELVRVCERYQEAGVNFSENELKLRDYEQQYILEKLECIFPGGFSSTVLDPKAG